MKPLPGSATPAALAHAMGNTLSASNALFATYCPVNLDDDSQRTGGSPSRPNETPGEQITLKSWNATVRKVGTEERMPANAIEKWRE